MLEHITIDYLFVFSVIIIWFMLGYQFALFAMGLVAAFVALSALFHRLDPPLAVAAGWYLLASLALIGGLAWVQRRLREET